MKIFGIDFTSAPGRKKPITVAEGELKQGTLSVKKIHAFVSFDEFEDFLEQKGPWMGPFCSRKSSNSSKLTQA